MFNLHARQPLDESVPSSIERTMAHVNLDRRLRIIGQEEIEKNLYRSNKLMRRADVSGNFRRDRLALVAQPGGECGLFDFIGCEQGHDLNDLDFVGHQPKSVFREE